MEAKEIINQFYKTDLEYNNLKRVNGDTFPIAKACPINFDPLDQIDFETFLKEISGLLKTRNVAEKDCKRVAILAKAGCGKTTFCKQYTNFSQNFKYFSFNGQVIHIPLRRLKNYHKQKKSYNLIDVFENEFFSQELEGKKLAKELFSDYKTNKDKYLFLLDGLDEVDHDILRDSSHSMHKCLMELLKSSAEHYLIVTTRPYISLKDYKFSLELQINGLDNFNVEKYINTFVREDLIQEVLAYKGTSDFAKSLMCNPFILDVICICFEEDLLKSKVDGEDFTLSNLFKIIIEMLWRKYLNREGIAFDDHMNSKIEKDIEFLEELAFNQNKRNLIQFSREDFTLENPDLIKSFIFQSELVGKKKHVYSFAHFYFQDYFAAKYIIRNIEEQEVIDFIRSNKYEDNFLHVLQFVAGMANINCANKLFDLLEQHPRDLCGGEVHQRLIWSCLNETVLPPFREKRLLDEVVKHYNFLCDNLARFPLHIFTYFHTFSCKVLDKLLDWDNFEDPRNEFSISVLSQSDRIPCSFLLKLLEIYEKSYKTKNTNNINLCKSIMKNQENIPNSVFVKINENFLQNPEMWLELLGGFCFIPHETLYFFSSILLSKIRVAVELNFKLKNGITDDNKTILDNYLINLKSYISKYVKVFSHLYIISESIKKQISECINDSSVFKDIQKLLKNINIESEVESETDSGKEICLDRILETSEQSNKIANEKFQKVFNDINIQSEVEETDSGKENLEGYSDFEKEICLDTILEAFGQSNEIANEKFQKILKDTNIDTEVESETDSGKEICLDNILETSEQSNEIANEKFQKVFKDINIQSEVEETDSGKENLEGYSDSEKEICLDTILEAFGLSNEIANEKLQKVLKDTNKDSEVESETDSEVSKTDLNVNHSESDSDINLTKILSSGENICSDIFFEDFEETIEFTEEEILDKYQSRKDLQENHIEILKQWIKSSKISDENRIRAVFCLWNQKDIPCDLIIHEEALSFFIYQGENSFLFDSKDEYCDLVNKCQRILQDKFYKMAEKQRDRILEEMYKFLANHNDCDYDYVYSKWVKFLAETLTLEDFQKAILHLFEHKIPIKSGYDNGKFVNKVVPIDLIGKLVAIFNDNFEIINTTSNLHQVLHVLLDIMEFNFENCSTVSKTNYKLLQHICHNYEMSDDIITRILQCPIQMFKTTNIRDYIGRIDYLDWFLNYLRQKKGYEDGQILSKMFSNVIFTSWKGNAVRWEFIKINSTLKIKTEPCFLEPLENLLKKCQKNFPNSHNDLSIYFRFHPLHEKNAYLQKAIDSCSNDALKFGENFFLVNKNALLGFLKIEIVPNSKFCIGNFKSILEKELKNFELVHLDLSENKLTDCDLFNIIPLIKENTKLESIILSHNEITHKGFLSLLRDIKREILSLKCLFLDFNNIMLRQEDINCIPKEISNILERVDLSMNIIPQEILEKLTNSQFPIYKSYYNHTHASIFPVKQREWREEFEGSIALFYKIKFIPSHVFLLIDQINKKIGQRTITKVELRVNLNGEVNISETRITSTVSGVT